MEVHGEQIHWCRFLAGRCLLVDLVVLASVLFFALWPSSVARAEAVVEDWVIECVDCPRYFEDVSPGALQADSKADLHVVYGSEHLYHAWTEDGTWKFEVVDTTLGAGHPAVLAIDQKDGLHIAYHHEGTQALKYAHFDDGGWQLSEVIGGLSGEMHLTVGVGPTGRVHVAFFDSDEKKLRYGYLDESSWHFELVEDGGGGRGVSLAVDGGGVPHLSYRCAGTCYAFRDESGWHKESVVANGYLGSPTDGYGDPFATSIALDAQDRPHVVSDSASDDFHLAYAVRGNGGWQVEPLFDSAEYWDDYWAGTASYTLVLDSSGTPHISFVVDLQPPKPGRTFGAIYASRNAEGWYTNWIADRSVPTLAWSQRDGPTIAYTDGMKLNHAQRPSADWTSEVIDHGGEAGRYAKVAVNTQGQLQIASYDSPNGSIRFAEWGESGWHVEPELFLFEQMDVDGRIGFALDDHGVSHLMVEVGTRWYPGYNQIGYAYREGGLWDDMVPHIEAAHINGHSLALDSSNTPHFSIGRYSGLGYGVLEMDGSWREELIDLPEGEWVADHTDLALTQADEPRIAYVVTREGGDHDLKYAFRNELGWHLDRVDSRGDVGQYVSLALDNNDRPRLSFYDATNGDLAFAAWDGADWQIQLVDRQGDVGRYTSLALDRLGFAHISYYDATNGSLKYARQIGEDWQIRTIDVENDVGAYSSIALYNGYPIIGYHDLSRHDLKVARRLFQPTDFIYLPLVRMEHID